MSIQVNNLSKSFRFFKRDAGLKGAFKSFFNRKYENFYALKDISFIDYLVDLAVYNSKRRVVSGAFYFDWMSM